VPEPVPILVDQACSPAIARCRMRAPFRRNGLCVFVCCTQVPRFFIFYSSHGAGGVKKLFFFFFFCGT
jgi:hypothetical protein